MQQHKTELTVTVKLSIAYSVNLCNVSMKWTERGGREGVG